MLSLLSEGKRPCILAGSAIISSDVRALFRRFIAAVQIPVVGGAMLSDILPNGYERFYGLSGNIGPRCGNFILQNADLILVLGSSLSFRQTGFNQDGFAPKARIVMVDIDEYEPRKPGLRIFRFIHSSLDEFFMRAFEMNFAVKAQEDWINYCESLYSYFDVYEGKEKEHPEGRVGQYNFWESYDRLVSDDLITVLGNNTAICAKLQTGVRTDAQRVVVNYTIGSMGYDLPAAIGAAVATKKAVICLTGDGSIMMNLQELQTIRQYDLPIHVVVFSNDGYNAIKQTCKNFFNGTVIGCSAETGVSFPDFQMVAHTFGFEYLVCEANSEIDETLIKVINSPKRILLDVKERLDDPLVPKVMSKMTADGKMQSPALDDMYPFLPDSVVKRFTIARDEQE